MLEQHPKQNITRVQKLGDGQALYLPKDVRADMKTEPGKLVKYEQVAPGKWQIFIVNMFISEELQPA